MTHEEFMRLPFESRRKIEDAIVSLDKAVQDAYGFSMLAEATAKRSPTDSRANTKLVSEQAQNPTPPDPNTGGDKT